MNRIKNECDKIKKHKLKLIEKQSRCLRLLQSDAISMRQDQVGAIASKIYADYPHLEQVNDYIADHTQLTRIAFDPYIWIGDLDLFGEFVIDHDSHLMPTVVLEHVTNTIDDHGYKAFVRWEVSPGQLSLPDPIFHFQWRDASHNEDGEWTTEVHEFVEGHDQLKCVHQINDHQFQLTLNHTFAFGIDYQCMVQMKFNEPLPITINSDVVIIGGEGEKYSNVIRQQRFYIRFWCNIQIAINSEIKRMKNNILRSIGLAVVVLVIALIYVR